METSVDTMPRNTFSARLRVGDKLIGIGFIEGTPPPWLAAIDAIKWIYATGPPSGREIPEQPLLSPLPTMVSGQNPAGGITESTPAENGRKPHEN